jgi:hypothetical protein
VKNTRLQNNWDNPEGGLDGLMQVSAAKRPKRRPFISKADLNPSGRPNLRPPNGGDKARNGGDGIKFYFLQVYLISTLLPQKDCFSTGK